MKPNVLRGIVFLCAATIQGAFVNVLFSSWSFSVPIVLSMVVALTILKGFAFSWIWALIGGMFLDALALGRIGGTSIELLLAAATFSVTAKQFHFGYRTERIFLFGGAVWFFALILRLSESFLFSLSGKAGTTSSLFPPYFSWEMLLGSFIISVLLFGVIFSLLVAFERYVELFERTRVGR